MHPAPTRGLQCKGRSPAGPLVIPAVPCSATLSTSGAYTTAHKARPPAPPLPADLMVTSGGGATSSSGGLGSPRALSPQRQSVFNQLATQMGVLGERAGGPRGQATHVCCLGALAGCRAQGLWGAVSLRTSVGNWAAAGGLAACFLPLNQSALASCVALRCLSGAPVPPHTGPAASPSDIHGVHRATVARGEDDFPSARLRVRQCCLLPFWLLWECSGCDRDRAAHLHTAPAHPAAC